MIRIVISDDTGNPGDHGLAIKAAIIAAYGSDIGDQIIIINGYENAKAYAVANAGVIALIRSYAGVAGFVGEATSLYPRVQYFFPMGSNTFQELSIFTNEEPPIIITSGAGDLEARNNTAYGKGLEFWDTDLSNDTGTEDASSYSNGTVLGKLLLIKDTLQCSWWEARFRARLTATRTEDNRQTYLWDIRNGYGRIDVNKAIAYKGLMIADPYLPAPHLYYNDEISITSPAKTIPANTYFASSKDLANHLAENALLEGVLFKGYSVNKDTMYGPAVFATISSFSWTLAGDSKHCKIKVSYYLNEDSLNKKELMTEEFILVANNDLINYLNRWLNINDGRFADIIGEAVE